MFITDPIIQTLSWLQVIVLAVVQGITEFLPISSSGHLVLVPLLTGWPDQGVAFDIALHIGTLLAVLVYFWRQTWVLTKGTGSLLKFNFKSENAMLVLRLAVATLPIILFALLLKDFISHGARSYVVLGMTSIVFGLLLGWADTAGTAKLSARPLGGWLAKVWPRNLFPKLYRKVAECLLDEGRKQGVKWEGYNKLTDMKLWHALMLGFFQALAIVPGTSRSGICMTAGRLLGFTRERASEIALLLAMPTIALALVFSLLFDLAEAGHGIAVIQVSSLQWITGVVTSFIVAWGSIWLLMRLVSAVGFWPFVYYRLGLGAMLITVYSLQFFN